jgi:hypothetical protein
MTARALFLAFLLATAPAHACVFTWDNPTTATDGTPLTDLAGTVLYFEASGTTGGLPQGQALAPLGTLTLTGPCRLGTYWAEAYTTLGVTSDRSNLVAVKKPNKPMSLVGSK